jgi:hypothetical protein
MGTEFNALSVWFWDDEFWLPPNVTWKTLRAREPEVSYASFGDLAYPLLLAWVIIVMRKLVENFVFRPIGYKLGMKNQVIGLFNLSRTGIIEFIPFFRGKLV